MPHSGQKMTQHGVLMGGVPKTLPHTISKSKFHCILVILIIFFLVFLSLPLFIIYLANYEFYNMFEVRKINATTGEPGPCSNGYFDCTNGTCINQMYQCDGEPHCPEGSDEKTCYDYNGAIKHIFTTIADPNKSNSNKSIPESCDDARLRAELCPCVLQDRRVVFCKDAGIEELPASFPDSASRLRFDLNRITSVDHVRWPSELLYLFLGSNRLEAITERSFAGARNLSKLFLGFNRIRHIHPAAFRDLRSLRQLNLSNNQLERFAPTLLEDKPALYALYLNGNQLDLDPEIRFSRAPLMRDIFLEQNRITVVRRHHFSNMSQLRWLNLAQNWITAIEPDAFENDFNLGELNLAFNRITAIDPRIFARDLLIEKLYLGANPLDRLPPEALAGLKTLSSLNLTQVEFRLLRAETFDALPSLKFIYFEHFSSCTLARKVRVCRPISDGLSSVDKMLAYPILRHAVMIVALVCTMGNAMVLVWRTVSQDEDRTLSLFVKNLSVADLMMGIYLCTIAWMDAQFEHNFRDNAAAWMASWQCTAIGFLAVLSSELSVFLLTIITVERYRGITSSQRVPCQQTSRARVSIALAWLFAILLASYPVIDWLLQDSSVSFATNGLCLPLHIDRPYERGWQFSAFTYLFVNFPAVLLMVTLYSRLYLIITNNQRESKPYLMGGEKRQEAILAIRFFFIVLTGCLCLMPVVVIRVLAPWLKISSAIYGWLVVFIIPINSALNPIVYTLANPSTRLCRLLGRLLRLLDGALDRLASGRRLLAASRAGPRRRRAASAPRGSNYSSSRSSTSISAGSEAQLISSVGRRRAKAWSNSTVCDQCEGSALAHAKAGSNSFESALLRANCPHQLGDQQQQQQLREGRAGNQRQSLVSSFVGPADEGKRTRNLLNVQLDLKELTGASNKVEPTLVGSDRELSLSGPSASTGSSTDQEAPTLALDESDHGSLAGGPVNNLLITLADPRPDRRHAGSPASSLARGLDCQRAANWD